MERENILKDIDDLEYYHQEVKKKYLKWAKGRLLNNGIGAENNKDTIDFLKKDSTVLKEFRKKLNVIKKSLRTDNNLKMRYEILREMYVIHPSFHELWFFKNHYNHFFNGGIISGRAGLKSYITSLRNETLERRIKVVSTYVLKQTILLENLFSGVLNYSLFDFSSLDDKEIVETINNLTIVSIHSPEDIKSKMPTLFKICKTLLERTEFETLKKNEPLSISTWLYYAPCNINEGPIFVKSSEKSRIDILKEINSIDQEEIRTKLSDYFKIKSIKDI